MPIEAAEITIYAELLLDSLDAIDARRLALIPELGDVLAAATDQLVEAVITLGCEMGRCAGRHAFADRPAVYDHNVLSGFGQFIGHGHARNAGSHDHHIGVLVAIERRSLINDGCVHPERDAAFTANVPTQRALVPTAT